MRHSASRIAAVCVFVVGVFASSIALAEDCPQEPARQSNVYFANGVLVEDSIDLEIAVRSIKGPYKNKLEALDPESVFTFRKSYNATQGRLTDFVQVLEQKNQELGIDGSQLSAYQMVQLVAAGLTNDQLRSFAVVLLGSSSPVTARLTDAALREIGESLVQSLVESRIDLQRTSRKHVDAYASDLIAGRRVFIIAHSQGNLFANLAVRSVRERLPSHARSIGVVGVATPAAVGASIGTYVTAGDDFVINRLRMIASVEPANVPVNGPSFNDSRDWFKHTFLRGYFQAGLPSRDEIDERMEQLVAATPYPVLDANTDPEFPEFDPVATCSIDRPGEFGLLPDVGVKRCATLTAGVAAPLSSIIQVRPAINRPIYSYMGLFVAYDHGQAHATSISGAASSESRYSTGGTTTIFPFDLCGSNRRSGDPVYGQRLQGTILVNECPPLVNGRRSVRVNIRVIRQRYDPVSLPTGFFDNDEESLQIPVVCN